MRDVQVLVIDSDVVIRKVLRTSLEISGSRVIEADNLADARKLLDTEDLSLVTLDIGIAGADGLAAGREIRARNDAPIMVISAQADRDVRNAVLTEFADDYLFKPFDIHEFLARSRALIRRAAPRVRRGGEAQPAGEPAPAAAATPPLRFRGYTLDAAAHRITDPQGRLVELTATEFKLLKAFVANANRVLSRERLLELSGGSGTADTLDRAIDMRVRRLRQKLGNGLDAPELIRTIRGVGYLFSREEGSA